MRFSYAEAVVAAQVPPVKPGTCAVGYALGVLGALSPDPSRPTACTYYMGGYAVTVLRAFLRPKTLLVAMAMVAMAASASDQTPTDDRVAKLHGFFKKLDCPVADLAPDFVRVADENQLDWRLLPSIALVESGGGKKYRNNNIFGWNAGQQAFPSIRSGLELVGNKLGQSRLYKHFDSLGKLHIYNRNKEYADSVLKLMNRISPEPAGN